MLEIFLQLTCSYSEDQFRKLYHIIHALQSSRQSTTSLLSDHFAYEDYTASSASRHTRSFPKWTKLCVVRYNTSVNSTASTGRSIPIYPSGLHIITRSKAKKTLPFLCLALFSTKSGVFWRKKTTFLFIFNVYIILLQRNFIIYTLNWEK